jgi:hypothetical protein
MKPTIDFGGFTLLGGFVLLKGIWEVVVLEMIDFCFVYNQEDRHSILC